jgi:hypothetical protein
VFWVDNAGVWQGPKKIGPAGLPKLGAYLAASQQFGLSQTDVFVAGTNGQPNVFWVDNAGAWQGPEKHSRPLQSEFTTMGGLAMRFRGLLRGGTVEKLDDWLRDARHSGIWGM